MTDSEQLEEENSRQQQPSFSARRLESFPAPDLEVLVGPKDRIYRYHAVILASHSGFVDKILSSPMGAKNREKKRIEFPEIDEDTWEKMIAFLEPGGMIDEHLEKDWIEQVLPFYEKYQFTDGLRLLDGFISKYIVGDKGSFGGFRNLYKPEEYVNLVVMCYYLAPSLPNASKSAVAWATEVLQNMTAEKEETIRQLLPLVENDEKLLQTLVKITKGRHYRDMRVDEMRSVTRAEGFPGEVLLKTKQIDELEKMMSSLTIESIRTNLRNDVYLKVEVSSRFGNHNHTGRGAMCLIITEQDTYRSRNNHEDGFLSLEAMDPFGLVWEMSSVLPNNNEVEDSNNESENAQEEDSSVRKVLYRWDCGYSSTFPPRHGWQRVDESSNVELKLDYRFTQAKNFY